MKRRALIAGSFDPITYGHLDLIERGLQLFDELLIVVSNQNEKQYCFSFEERMQMVAATTNHLQHVKVIGHTAGLIVDVAKQYDVHVLLRGIRNMIDMEYERTMATLNKQQQHDIETIFLFSQDGKSAISSSGVRELARLGANIDAYVPATIATALYKKIQPEKVSVIDEA